MLRRACLTVLCIVLLPATVQAFDHHHHHASHHSGGDGCGSSSGSHSATPPPASAPSSTKRVFVTSTSYAGAVGGLFAADAFCQESARAEGLPGAYRAWLSNSKTNAFDRLRDVPGGWYTTRGELAFASKDALRDAPQADLRDERGNAPSGAAWSGSDASGAAVAETCDDWTNGTSDATATTASAFAGDVEWGGGGGPVSCDRAAPLVCFGQ